MHVAAIGVLFTSVWLMDLRMLGLLRALAERPFIALMRRMALGAFAVALLTGLALFSVRAGDYAAMPVFLAKIGLIALAGLNLGFFLLLDRTRPAEAAPNVLRKMAVSLSAILWTSVLLAGRFIGFS